MKIVVVGGGGFIGSNLTRLLLEQGHEVRVFDRPRIRKVLPEAIDREIEWVYGDFLDISAVSEAVAGCDVAYHLVSTTLPNHSNQAPVYDVESNLIGAMQLMQVLLERAVGRLVFVSSGGTVYGVPRRVPIAEDHPTEPICSYGISKLAIEKYCALYHHLNPESFDYVVFRLSNPYGPYQNPVSAQGAIGVFLNKAIRGEPIEIWGDGSVVRDYLYIGDAVDALSRALKIDGGNRVFNLGSGKGRTLNGIVEAIEAVVGHGVERVYKKARPVDVPENVLDISRIRREMGWEPKVSLEEGLALTKRFLLEAE